MNRSQPTILATAIAVLAGTLVPTDVTRAEAPGYQAPSFYNVGQQPEAPGFTPPFPASPLAGGAAAAQGDAFMDAHGQSIVMPAGYCQGCPGGSGEAYPDGMGGYGDPMAVDFGGYGQDQCGPHFFDVAFDVVYLQNEDLVGESLGAFTSLGIGSAPGETEFPFLDPTGAGGDLEPGWRIALRYDIGALAVLEATYMGLYDFGFEDSVRSVDVDPSDLDNQLFSIYSAYGFIDPDLGDGIVGIPGLDEASQHSLKYQSDLQSTELSYRRYWVGYHPRITGTMLCGFRYVRMTEDFLFSAITENGNGSIGYSTDNDLLGFQVGGDAWACVKQGLRFGVEGKAGIYNNRFEFLSAANDVFPDPPPGLQAPADGNQVAFVAEGGVSFVADILPSWSIRGGYEAFYLNSLVTLQGNIDTTIFDTDTPVLPLHTEGHQFYHGFHGGLEYVW